MLNDVVQYIVNYGYIIIFCLVFLQEIGIPSFPNEILLLYAGILARQHVLNYSIVLILVIAADITGTFSVYLLFYYCKPLLVKIKPNWLKLPSKKINLLSKNINEKGITILILGRLTPFVRGYVSVASGLLHISSKKYLPILLLTATFWTGGWVTIGYYFSTFIQNNNIISHLSTLTIPIFLFIALIILFTCIKKYNQHTKKELL